MNADPRPIRVVTLADEAYGMPLAVMGRSLLENHRSGRPLLLKVIDGGITPASRERIARSWDGATTSPSSWEWVEPTFGPAGHLPVWGRMTALTYARLFIHAYFHESGDRALLLDSDMLVLTDVAALHDVDLQGKVAGACVDPFIPTVSSVDGLPAPARAGLSDDTPYLNAGMMVIDLALWRKERVGERALEYIGHQRRHLRQYDQDALNAVLAGRWKQLDGSWNTQPRTDNALGVAVPDRPRIVHFSGRLKPWLYQGGSALDRLFLDVVDRTDWKGFRPRTSWRSMAWRLYDSPLRRVVHGLERRMFAWQRSIQLRGSSPPER